MSVPDVQVSNAACSFPKREGGGHYLALRDVSFSIAAGEFFCLLGPSGCGKSTVLRMIAGFLSPTAGEIQVRGQGVRGPGADRAVVFQGDSAIFNWLTVEENISFGPRMRKIREQDYRPVVAKTIRLVGTRRFENYQPNQLSGGMRQRLQIARVLVNDPGILLMDEPFGALDAQTRDIMQQELSRIWSGSRKTVLFITHDIDEVVSAANRIAVMTAGPAATIKTIFDVPLLRPRELNEQFLKLRQDVRAAIHEEVTKSMRQLQ